jgi:transcriptional regulator with XRE-family HTH domain
VTRVRDLHDGWMKHPAYRDAYDALEDEFTLAAVLIRARIDAGLTQEQLAERMGTKQEVVARWESGKVLPSTRTLARLAKATGTALRISFMPVRGATTGRRSRKASGPGALRRTA